jgi:membrane protease YdiL (CAAX protease family)
VLTSEVREARGSGFPWRELLTTVAPAAVHEELLFRGYAFQKIYRRQRGFAIIFVAAIFASLHMGNDAVTVLGLTNVFLGGILLGLAYARFARLWFPIGLHLAWNLMTGPILGHEVSGYQSARTLFIESGGGAVWITGGEFGLEGSAWLTLVVLCAIAVMNIQMNFPTGRGVARAAKGVIPQ